eukprot:TRINITY_DN19528_c0_g1_i1.p1 TRINITY_DN19528_c0_g1~~TRINITY_DN19528_c0_g1_i1.p1  ORF type:complete len:581 (-),score=34.82 TRINITY_DN19528_c0_g1_i1:320-1936(-)
MTLTQCFLLSMLCLLGLFLLLTSYAAGGFIDQRSYQETFQQTPYVNPPVEGAYRSTLSPGNPYTQANKSSPAAVSGHVIDRGKYDMDTERNQTERTQEHEANSETDRETGVEDLFFAITSSASSWQSRKRYVRAWWNSSKLRGGVWLDQMVEEGDGDVPLLHLSSATKHMGYTGEGTRDSLSRTRVILDAVRQSNSSVRWFVKGDDDTLFSPEGVAGILSKYDHTQMMFVGSHSETYSQNCFFSHEMAYGGGGFAFSRPLALALNLTLDSCMERHVDSWGADSRTSTCVAELGVALTVERGFHQCDLRGSLEGFLAAHPLSVFASLHHFDQVTPLFPGAADAPAGVEQLAGGIRADPIGFLQQSVCYDQEVGAEWTASIAWGFSVKVYDRVVRLADLLRMERSFVSQAGRTEPHEFTMDTRNPETSSNESCGFPFVLYCTGVTRAASGEVVSRYERKLPPGGDVNTCMKNVSRLLSLEVVRGRPMSIPSSSQGRSTGSFLQRQCCDHLTVQEGTNGTEGLVLLRDCEEFELIAPRADV